MIVDYLLTYLKNAADSTVIFEREVSWIHL